MNNLITVGMVVIGFIVGFAIGWAALAFIFG